MIILEITPRDVNEQPRSVMPQRCLRCRGERASRNGFRKLDALQSVARNMWLPAANDWPFLPGTWSWLAR